MDEKYFCILRLTGTIITIIIATIRSHFDSSLHCSRFRRALNCVFSFLSASSLDDNLCVVTSGHASPVPCAHAPRGHAKLWKLVKSLQAGKKTLREIMYDTHAGFLANLLKSADTFALQRSSCTAYASTVRGCPTCYWFFPWSFDTLGHNCTNYYNLV